MIHNNMKLYLLVLALFIGDLVYATSSGLGIDVCDAYDERVGCDTDRFEGGDRKKCLDKDTQVMHWATKPVRTAMYAVVAGPDDNPVNQVSQYIPGDLLPVHIVTRKYGMRFRGLLLYAVNEQGDKVGDWELVNDEPKSYIHPGICEKAVYHAHADFKPYVNTFFFRAPSEGTGKITFHALVKFGDANKGEFYWPNEDADTSLEEGVAPVEEGGVTYLQGDIGQSCTEVCNGREQFCSIKQTRAIDSVEKLRDIIGKDFPCQFPITSQCSSVGLTSSADDTCYFHNAATCALSGREPEEITCEAKSNDETLGRRFCACVTEEDADSSASLPGVSKVILLISAMFTLDVKLPKTAGFSKLSSGVVLLLFCSTFLPTVQAHNWVGSMSRAYLSSTKKPCLAPLSNVPHVQVAKNQEFDIEWVTGHGSSGYFTVLHADDADKLPLITKNVLEDYIKNAPAGAVYEKTDAHWHKYHRKETAENYNTGKKVANYWKEQITEGPFYFPRDQAITEAIREQRANGVKHLGMQFSYKPEDLDKDIRVAYESEKYPWIESVHRFEFTAEIPTRSHDFAKFKIEGRKGAGRHVIHYLWRGYNDCIDVDVVEDPNLLVDGKVENMYGLAAPEDSAGFKRIDHCIFPNIRFVLYDTCAEVVTDVAQCYDIARKRGDSDAFAVQPIGLPDTVHRDLRDTLLPPFFFPNGSNEIQPDQCDGTAFANLTPEERKGKYVCYVLQTTEPSDTVDRIQTSDDASDPVYYSTCFLKYKSRVFASYKENPTQLGWRSGKTCVSCEAKAIAETFADVIPRWDDVKEDSTGECVNCELSPTKLEKDDVDLTFELKTGFGDTSLKTREELGYELIAPEGQENLNFKCKSDVSDTCTGCLKTLTPLGVVLQSAGAGRYDTYISPEACLALVDRDPECSSVVNYQERIVNGNIRQRGCFCYKKESCCGECQPERNYEGTNIYKIPDASTRVKPQSTYSPTTQDYSQLSAEGDAPETTTEAGVGTDSGIALYAAAGVGAAAMGLVGSAFIVKFRKRSGGKNDPFDDFKVGNPN